MLIVGKCTIIRYIAIYPNAEVFLTSLRRICMDLENLILFLKNHPYFYWIKESHNISI
jgi:hypothetical protein